ncbi:Aste57867_17874 [Aphanomyces stellatus]|uniref:Aste57867_17874 protein n=1 Tax=Aphanomyces stellatus TaxID=120398 RepID=A0A485L8N2_9STRA|nr:hypothetical protein As57867_017813 [Aphanomyces stellatus]VFT94617.1 Aste57867_17874 [Aphanomyces stellatus]
MCRPLENPVNLGGGLSSLPQHADYGSPPNMYMTSMSKQQQQSFAPMPFINPMMPSYQKPAFEFVVQPNSSRFDMATPSPMFGGMDQEATSMQDLLECALFDDDVNLNEDDLGEEITEEFDNQEIDILYSFLMDKSQANAPIASAAPASIYRPPFPGVPHDPNDGVISLNLMDDSPLDAYLSTSDEDVSDNLLNIQLEPPAQFKSQLSMPKSDSSVELDEDDDDEGSAHGDKNRRLCKMVGCQRRSRSHGLCISHGGGRRCAVDGCGKSSQGGNLCIKHGGGKRCEMNGCNRAAQSNNLCKAHGGGPRCLFEGCDRSSQGGGYCRSHGGGKRCLFEGCDKGTQRGEFCALHGGSRLCGVAGCMRNDRGGGFCATHGGGKRCSQEGCEKPCRRRGLCSAHIRLLEDK